MNFESHFTFEPRKYICPSADARTDEICVLTWEDIDTEVGTTSVRKTIQCIYNVDEGNRHTELIIDTPKTKNSIRDIPMSKDLIRMLKPIKKVVNNSFFVLTNDANPTEPRTYRNYYKNSCGMTYLISNFTAYAITLPPEALKITVTTKLSVFS
jgi:integrase